MSCRDTGFMQAFLDGECGREEGQAFAEHLESCGQCRQRLDELMELESWSRAAIEQGVLCRGENVPVDTEAAWKSFQRRLLRGEAHNLLDQKVVHAISTKRGWRNMNRKVKHWVAGASAAVILLGALSFPEVQAAANQFLSIFRIDKVEFVKLTEDDLRSVEQWLSSDQAGEMDLKGIGKLWVEEGNRDHQYYESAEKAAKAGHRIPAVPDSVKVEGVSVSPHFTLHLKLDTEKANRLLRQMKSEARFDEELNGKQFSLTVPKGYDLQLNDGETTYSYRVFETPKVTAPEGVDLERLRATILTLPFIPENVRQQLADIDDWQHTLPMPYLDRETTQVREVSINGAKGVLHKDKYFTRVIWQKDGHMYMLDTSAIDPDRLLALAKQLN
jgi:hypothetical protein